MDTDETLMSRFQQGDDDAFEQIVRRCEGRMLSFFYRAIGDMDTARDLRQELFLRLYVHGHSYRGDGSLVAWLYSIATNLLRGHCRQRKLQAPPPELDGALEGESVETVDVGPRADEVAQRHERARLVRRLLADLSSKDREVLLLRFFGGLRFEEVSKALGIRESTTRVRAIRAIERLRRIAAKQGLTANDLL